MNYSAPCKFCGQVQTFEGEEGMSNNEQMRKAMRAATATMPFSQSLVVG